PPDQDGIKLEWLISDGTDITIETSYLTLISSPPLFWQYSNNGTPDYLSHFYISNGTNPPILLPYDSKNEIGRVNTTLYAYIVVGDPDFNRDILGNPEKNQTEVVLCMNITTQEGNYWINITLDLNKTIAQFDDPALDLVEEPKEVYGRCLWDGFYTFTDDDPIGDYDFWILTKDLRHGNQSRFEKVIFSPSIQVKDWYAEIDNFSNNTNEIFRINETLTINAEFFDMDDYRDDDNLSKPQLYNDSNLLRCEENTSLSLTNIGINGTYFENDYHATYYDDSVYHSIVNDSNGEILIPYAINLTNAAVIFENITEIEIKLKAKINSTVNISFAGWRIYNWTSNSMIPIEDLVFNDTVENLDVCYLTNQNLSHFVNETYNNRIEIFFYVNTNNSNSTMAKINYVCFNVTYPVNRTGIIAEIQLESLAGEGWINRTMDHDKIREFWSFSWTFSSLNKSGLWRIHFNLTDKEGISKVYDTGYNISVKNHAPKVINWSKSANFIYRKENMFFFANTTDLDTNNRSTDLTVTAKFYHPDTNTWINETMDFNSSINAWELNWTPSINIKILGNYTYTIEVTDSDGDFDHYFTNLNFSLLNNLPVIIVTNFIPSDFILYDGESIEVMGNISDVEGLNFSFVQISDSSGKLVKKRIWFPIPSENKTFRIRFTKNDYRNLDFKGKWNLYIFLNDSNGGIAEVNYRIALKFPPILPPPPPFAWDYLIIAGLTVSVVLGTILVYRFYKREKVVIPASRVKAIIKKMIEEKEIAELEEERLIKERLEKEKLKRKPPRKIKEEKPVSKERLEAKKEKLDKLEIKNLEVRLSETLNSARQAIRKKNFNYAAELYQRAAKISSKLGDIDKAQRFSERAEELYKRGKKKLS
ncbi:MAG: hypothetical protein ACFFDN_46730, partial [Candidatus Hodarchaeota archaeon]